MLSLILATMLGQVTVSHGFVVTDGKHKAPAPKACACDPHAACQCGNLRPTVETLQAQVKALQSELAALKAIPKPVAAPQAVATPQRPTAATHLNPRPQAPVYYYYTPATVPNSCENGSCPVPARRRWFGRR